MSANTASDITQLEELFRRFDDVAFKYPYVDAVVVHLPDLRREETARQAIERLYRIHPASATQTEEERALALAGLGQIGAPIGFEAWRFAHRADYLIPPFDKTIEQLGFEKYWHAVVLDSTVSDSDSRKCFMRWQCDVYGPPVADEVALRHFHNLASEASRLILPVNNRNATQPKPSTDWLVHLADWEYPADSADRRHRILDLSCWPEFGCGWSFLNPREPPPQWWAIRLTNIFQHSRDAVRKAIDLAATEVLAMRVAIDAVAKPKERNRPLKEPKKDAIAVYRYQFATGKKQTELADDPALMKQLGRKVDQGTISRWLKKVNEWISAGNILAPLPVALDSKPKPMDPRKLDCDKRRDGRAKHQKHKRKADRDD